MTDDQEVLFEKTGRLWDSLTEEQKQSVLLSYEESEDENELIDADLVFGKGK